MLYKILRIGNLPDVLSVFLHTFRILHTADLLSFLSKNFHTSLRLILIGNYGTQKSDV